MGSLYQSAKEIYDYEQSDYFLEDYTIDTLRNNAPVDGVEITCSPQIWSATSVVRDLQNSIRDNIISLNTGSNSSDYFNIGSNVRNVNFLTDPSWPSYYEVNPTEGDLMVANPVGNQEGLGILGFCYTTYHFVYSVKYPVLISVHSGDEIFQFPMAVVVDNNVPRKSLEGIASSFDDAALCQQGTTRVSVGVFDSNSNPVNANISYECFGQSCDIGRTSGGALIGDFPQCVNGYIVASAQGFKQGRYLFSTTDGGTINVVLDKVYSKPVNLLIEGIPYSGDAIITFSSDSGVSSTLNYPSQKEVNLSEGDYSVQVYVYKDASVNVGSSTYKQCVDVPLSGLAGIFGSTRQECYDIEVPEQILSSALSGGGTSEVYISESDLSSSIGLNMDVSSFPNPTSLGQIQANYLLFDTEGVTLNFV